MNIQEAIKKAIEGGWNGYDGRMHEDPFIPEADCMFYLLDLPFWQALGKALGWGKGTIVYMAEPRLINGKCREEKMDWKYYWHSFINYLIAGKSAEDFFKEL